MRQDYLIALALGLVASVAFMSATTGPLPMRLILFLITPLPLLLAGLGWGVRAAVVAGLAGAVLLMTAGPMVAAVFALSQAVPAAVLSYLAMLNRAVPEAEAASGASQPPTQREWYPPGRLVVWTAFMAAVPAIIWSVVADANRSEIIAALAKGLDDAFKAGAVEAPGGGPWTPENIAQFSAKLYAILPAGSAVAWMSGLLLTLWMAGRIMRASGQLTRPWPDLAGLEFPSGTALAFGAVTLAAVLLEGPAGIVGRAFCGALLFAYFLLGLAIIHFITRAMSWRPFVLWGLYTALLLGNGLVAIPIAIIGLTDGLLQLRRRYGSQSGGT